MTNQRRTNRRDVLKAAALGATGWWTVGGRRSAWAAGANEKLNIALVGTGNRGRGFVRKIDRLNHNLVAVCDVDEHRLDALANLPSSAGRFRDFRKLLDELDRQIDAVIVATTDHNHAAVTAAAMKRGKHVFCEKPLTHNIGEARAIRQLTKERPELVTQMGNQGIATDTFRRILEQVRQGAVGDVREVHAWFDGMGGTGPLPLPTDDMEVPESFDWDVYLGPAANRPYHPTYVRARDWRDFSTGRLGVCFTHSIHMAFRGLDVGVLWEGSETDARVRVQAEFSEPCAENYPVWQIVRYDVPARGDLPPVRIHCYNGRDQFLAQRGILERMEAIAGRPLDWGSGWARTSGSLLVGSKGIVHTNAHNSKCALLPLEDFSDQGGPPRTIPVSGASPTISDRETDVQIMREWTDAIQGGRATFSDFDRAGPVTEFALLGNIATLVGEPLEFDPVAGRITNHDGANEAIHPPRREGWEL